MEWVKSGFKSSICIMLLIGAGTSYAQDPGESGDFLVYEARAGIYLVEGPGGLADSGGNIGLSIGEDGVFIIDDQFEDRSTRLQQFISTMHDQPIQFLINTHFHYDHTDANESLGESGAVIVAHENARERMSVDSMIEAMNRPQPAYDTVGLPVVTFQEEITFHYNDHTIQVFHHGPAHTDGDSIIHFTEANVIHTGDVFVRYGLPFIDVPNGGNVNGMIRVMHALIELADEETLIIPGHGLMATQQDMVDYVTMLEVVRDRVYEGILQNLSIDDIAATIPTRGYPANGFITNESFTGFVYDSFFQ